MQSSSTQLSHALQHTQQWDVGMQMTINQPGVSTMVLIKHSRAGGGVPHGHAWAAAARPGSTP